MSRLAQRLAATLAVLALLSTPAFPQANTAPPVGAVLVQLVAETRFDEARAVLDAWAAGKPDAALHRAHLEGVIRLRQGRTDEAIAIFRTILTADPGFIPARVELARALQASGDADGAYHHFEIIAHAGEDRSLETMAAAAMEAIVDGRPWGVSLHGALLPSTNVNKGSGHQTFEAGGLDFTIDDQARATSGVGASVGGSAFATANLDEVHALTASLGLDLRKYTNGTDFDQATLNASLMLTRRHGDAVFGIGPVATQTWKAWQPYLAQYGVAARATAAVTQRDIVGLSFQALGQDYADLDHRDGWLATGRLSWKHHVSPALSITAHLGGTIERTQRAHLDHDDIVAGLRIDNEWQGGLITGVFGAVENHAYVGDYPLTDAPRHDQEISVGATLSHRSIAMAGFMPQLTYTYTRQFSTISFFDHDSHDINLGLSKRF